MFRLQDGGFDGEQMRTVPLKSDLNHVKLILCFLLFIFFIGWLFVAVVPPNRTVMVHEPAVLIEGVLFRANYLGSTQIVCEGQPTKYTRMMQAEEAVSRIKVKNKITLSSLLLIQK